jgi:rubredoxin
MSSILCGPALKICPECGAEIEREMFTTDRGTFVLPLPRTCPECDAALVPKVRHEDLNQAKLPGVA